MDSLQHLLGRYAPQEPAEVAAIKRYIHEQFRAESSVTARKDAFVITVTSASLANTLRMRMLEIKAAAQTDRRLVFRIG